MTGSFSSSVFTGAGQSYSRYVEVVWSSTNNKDNNTSTISWTAYTRSKSASTTSVLYAKNIIIKFGSQSKSFYTSTAHATKKDEKIGTGTFVLNHKDDGSLSVEASISASFYSYGTPNSTGKTNISLPNNPVYDLDIVSDTGCTIVVHKVSNNGSLVQISPGQNMICDDDVIKITAIASDGYKITKLTVNNKSFVSGSTYVAKGDVAVSAVSGLLYSSVQASSTSIGGVSTITITQYNSSYCHSLKYSFGGLSGYITEDGECSNTEVKYNRTTVSFTIPNSFYQEIPNNKNGKCVITCTTYESLSSSTTVGSSSYEVDISVSTSPGILVIACGESSSALQMLTESATKLIRYRANVNFSCAIGATIGATLSSVSINDQNIVIDTTKSQLTVYHSFKNFADDSITIKVVDSRGLVSTKVLTNGVNWTVVDYIPLTLNPVIKRVLNNDNKISISFSGSFFTGSFGAVQNSLMVKYRYRNVSDNGVFTAWQNIPTSDITYSESDQTFSSVTDIVLPDEFDYRKEYVFEVNAIDGAPDENIFGTSIVLTSITKIVSVPSAIPGFDWGQHDFNFNVPIYYNRKALFDILYPVGAIVLNVNNVLPSDMEMIGQWESVTTGLNDIYGWKRIE